jgi:hypothetical protein
MYYQRNADGYSMYNRLTIVFKMSILWHADPLLGNNRETSNIQLPLLSNGFSNKQLQGNDWLQE